MGPWLLVLSTWVPALAALLRPSQRSQEAALVLAALAHLGGTAALWGARAPSPRDLLGPDPLGLVILSLLSLVFAAVALYSLGYLRHQRVHRPERPLTGYVPCLLASVGALTLACLARHLGLVWIGLETAGLAVAPLVYFLRTQQALEAAWKYLVLSSVGVAFGLLGTFFVALSSVGRDGAEASLFWPLLVGEAPRLSVPWLDAGFALLLVGYGTKMGLAPLHAWKPDAYGEAPAPVSALLAGASPVCALLGILRTYAVLVEAGQGAFARQVLIGVGALSMVVGAALVVGQRDFKRLLAYSSVEHMGFLALAMGAGGPAVGAALLHALGNGLSKALLYLSLGDVHRDARTRLSEEARGSQRRLPVTAVLILVGWAAAVGLPPWPLFQSELGVLASLIGRGQTPLAALVLVVLLIGFTGLTVGLLTVVTGEPAPDRPPSRERTRLFVAPSLALAALLLALGLGLPAPLLAALREAAGGLGGSP